MELLAPTKNRHNCQTNGLCHSLNSQKLNISIQHRHYQRRHAMIKSVSGSTARCSLHRSDLIKIGNIASWCGLVTLVTSRRFHVLQSQVCEIKKYKKWASQFHLCDSRFVRLSDTCLSDELNVSMLPVQTVVKLTFCMYDINNYFVFLSSLLLMYLIIWNKLNRNLVYIEFHKTIYGFPFCSS